VERPRLHAGEELTKRLLHRAAILRTASIVVSLALLTAFSILLGPLLERKLGAGWSNIAEFSLAFLILIWITRPLHELVRESARAIEELLNQTHSAAVEDPLTAVFNRRHLDARLGEEFARARRHRHSLSLILADLDRLKVVNDQKGHAAGDEVLRQVAMLLRRNVRREDIVARIGGDEFCILMPQTELRQAAMKADQIRIKITESILVDNEPMTVSFGVAAFSPTDSDPTDVMQRADDCLYDAKLRRNEVCFMLGAAEEEEEAPLGPTN
jgi:diguanylate cyclase (GGDEF)-like protein